MKKIKKQIPAILYSGLLLIIAALCIAIVDSENINADADNNTDNDNIIVDKDDLENTTDEIDNPDKNPSDNPDDNPDVKPNPDDNSDETIYNDVIPRPSLPDNIYSYTQKIYGNGTIELCDVFQTSVGVYVLVKSDCSNGDIEGTNPCIGIIKMDAYGNIVKALSLNYTHARNYITASPTPLGLVVVTAPEDYSDYYISIISYELDSTPVYRISAANGGKIVPTATSFLFFAEYSDESMVYAYSNENFSFQSVGKGKITEVFEYGTYYVIISSNEQSNSYYIAKLSKNTLSIMSETTCSGAVSLDVFPVPSETGQAFIVIENRNGAVWAKKFSDSSFTQITATKKIGNFEMRGAYYDGENLLIVCKGNLNGIIVLSPNLETKFNENSADFVPSEILDGIYSSGTLYYLACDATGKLALLFARDSITNAEFFDVITDNARFIINLDGSFNIFYQSGENIEIIGLKK